MKTTIFVLVALVAMIGIAFGIAPLQLSGDTGKNISANLTDDVAFMAVEQFNGTSIVYVFTPQQIHSISNLNVIIVR